MNERLVFGIQGGIGSFNEKAIVYYAETRGIVNYEIRYLFATEPVLRELSRGSIDRGQFAIHNTLGGLVDESLNAMGKYNFEVLEKFSIKIAHALMIRPDATLGEVTTIMTHPQVLAQCKDNLSKKYPTLKQTSGDGNLIDHAEVARLLHEKTLPKNIAVMGSNILAKVYSLTVIEDNLQDNDNNFTTFLIVK